MPRWLFVAVATCSFVACKTKAPDHTRVATCVNDGDCTLFCESKGDCCHDPYCEAPALASDARAIEEYNREHCTKSDYDKCPRIGARMDTGFTAAAHCQAGTCVVERQRHDGGVGAASTLSSTPSPPTSQSSPNGGRIVDVGGYDRSCASKSDCVVVKAAPCDKCACASTPIAKKEGVRFRAAASAIDCTGMNDTRRCGECRGAVADCVAGRCVAVPEE
ncbi:MAG: hypothetical protein ACRELB_05135 [Polyangiaceae bacterium]